ncbi:hypothetical protein AAFF_G00278520 [Aldrovandia affinis]|uniref:Uncharacterized protein n=1 Tax=Aldrovandia affinis TaxID=143900 RepID=A0AAD7WSD9_9TELE|nr:hypothetical protein AAFF_G00278520 [Aldrovandia affinis]
MFVNTDWTYLQPEGQPEDEQRRRQERELTDRPGIAPRGTSAVGLSTGLFASLERRAHLQSSIKLVDTEDGDKEIKAGHPY